MIWLYVLALLFVAFGAIKFFYFKSIVWWEWLAGAAIAFGCAGIMHFSALKGMIADTETWSGHVTKVVHYPYWLEHYTTIESYSCGTDGKDTCYRTVEHWDHHPEYWEAETSVGDHTISEEFFNQIVGHFKGGIATEKIYKPNFYSGDPNIYVGYNKSGYIYPATAKKSFENRVKAAPTVFSFPKVPEGEPVFEYPANKDWTASDRLMGTAKNAISLMEFDRMNTRLGPVKKVNIILIGFGNQDKQIAMWQEAKFVGGKKNDLVLCYGGSDDPSKATWAYVFGWTEKEDCKRNLETLLLTNKISTRFLSLIEEEVRVNYEIKDWSKFDYISVEPPTWCYFLFLFILILTQGGFYFYCHGNEFQKGCENDKRDIWGKKVRSQRWR